MGLKVSLVLSFLSSMCLIVSIQCKEHRREWFDGRFLGCDPTMMREIHFFETRQQTRIAVLESYEGKKFIVKQKGKEGLGRYLCAIREKLGIIIAESIGIRANRVEIIPAHYAFPGKHSSEYPATLHEFVEGVMARHLPKEYFTIAGNIKQSIKGSVPFKDGGFNRSVIKNMAAHEDLCTLVALDTFIANGDRNRKNYFYNQEIDHFIAIDFSSSFGKDLASCACMFVESMIKNHAKITEKELNALKIYRNTLKKLIQLHTPHSLYNTLEELIIKARVNRLLINDKINTYKNCIERNYSSCQKLVDLLDIFIVQNG